MILDAGCRQLKGKKSGKRTLIDMLSIITRCGPVPVLWKLRVSVLYVLG